MPSKHSQVMPKKCATCHMYKESDKADEPRQKGGHTFHVDDKVCLKCHEDPKVLVTEWQTKVKSMLEQLKVLLDSAQDKTSKSYRDAQANYNMVIADVGLGVHNPQYAQALLQYSISSLKAESVWKR